jgi:hypothetical protein
MGMAAIVSLIAVAGALVLAVRGLRSHQLPFEKQAWMAAAWLLVIAVLAFVFDRMGA